MMRNYVKGGMLIAIAQCSTKVFLGTADGCQKIDL